jgi:hypothetical protein
MSTQALLGANARLLETADRLVAEFDGIVAGSVPRCFSRALIIARRSGVTRESLPIVAADGARHLPARPGRSRSLVGVA